MFQLQHAFIIILLFVGDFLNFHMCGSVPTWDILEKLSPFTTSCYRWANSDTQNHRENFKSLCEFHVMRTLYWVNQPLICNLAFPRMVVLSPGAKSFPLSQEAWWKMHRSHRSYCFEAVESKMRGLNGWEPFRPSWSAPHHFEEEKQNGRVK